MSSNNNNKAPLLLPRKRLFTFGKMFGWFVRLIRRLIVSVLVFLVILWGMLQIPAVQNWLGDRAAELFSDLWKMRVEIGKLKITFFNKVEVENAYLEDQYGDTILFARRATSYFDVISIFGKQLNMNRAELEDGVFNYVRHKGDIDFEFMKIIKFFQPKVPKPPAEQPFRFGITNARFTNARFRFFDANIGTEVKVYAPYGYVDGRGNDFITKKLNVKDIFIESPKVRITINQPDTIMPDSILALAYPYYPYTDLLPRWNLWADHLNVENLSLHILNNKLGGPDPQKGFDPNDLKLDNVYLSVDSFSLEKEVFRGIVKNLSGKEARGFQITSVKGNAVVSPTEVSVNQLEARTPYSVIRDSFAFKYKTYRDFFDFVNKVKFASVLTNSEITIRDIAMFSPVLQNNPFFSSNANKKVVVNGSVLGTVNDMRIKDFNLKMPNETEIAGNLSMNNITVPDGGLLDLRIDKFNSSGNAIRELLPFAKLPPHIGRLGSLQFKGSFVGFVKDFVAYGTLNTSIGTAKTDVKMSLRGKVPKYSGDAALIDFDLGALLDNDIFGKTTVTTNVDFLAEKNTGRVHGITGEGFILDALQAEMKNGRVVYANFKGYQYDNILIDGLFFKKRFDGNIVSTDANFDIKFNGVIDLNGELPELDVIGKVKNIDFRRLNILKDTATLKIDSLAIDVRGNTIDNFNGTLFLKNIKGKKGSNDYKLDSISLEAKRQFVGTDTLRIIRLKSDLMRMNVIGTYDFVSLPKSLIAFAGKYHPNLFSTLSIPTTVSNDSIVQDTGTIANDSLPYQNVTVDLKMKDSRNFTELLTPEFKHIKDVNLVATFDSKSERVTLNGKVKEVKIATVSMREMTLTGQGVKHIFRLYNDVEGVYLNDSSFIPSFRLNINALGDTLNFVTRLQRVGQVASDVNLHGKLAFGQQQFQIQLDTADLSFFGMPWSIRGDNYIRFGKNRLEVNGVRLTNTDQIIELRGVGERGLHLCMANMDLGWWYNLKPVPKLNIGGTFSSDVRVDDVFKLKGMNVNLYLDSLNINGDNWGTSRVVVDWDSLKSPIRAAFVHHSDIVDSIGAVGFFIPTFAAKDKDKENYLQLGFSAKNASPRIIEYFLAGQISDVKGSVQLMPNVRSQHGGMLKGKINQLNISGHAKMKDMEMKVNFLQTRYFIPEGGMELGNYGFTFSPNISFDDFGDYESGGITAYDELGNMAKIGGGITHNRFKNFGLDMQFYIPSQIPVAGSNKTKPNNFLAMQTTEKDNSTFYGTVYGSGKLHFYGPFEKLKLSIDAKTHAGTVLSLPLSSPQDVEDVKYVTFVDKIEQRRIEQENKNKAPAPIIGGLDMDMNIEVTPDAEARLIFDERTGDIISGRGAGNLRMTFNAAGELGMFGDYTIQKGQYLFTYQNIVNKQFDVKQGGTIIWTGSPYEAHVDIQGAYMQQASPYNLIFSYLQDEASRRAAGNNVEVELQMGMRGSLLSPDISFNIEIPEDKVDARLRTHIDLALQGIRNDKNELNRQVFALIALQQFLPVENTGGGGQGLNLVSTTVNTLSEMLSQQLSMHINDLLSQVLSEQGIDFEIDLGVNLRDQNSTSLLGNTGTSNAEVRLGFDPSFFGGRLRLHIGGTADIGGSNLGNINGGAGQYIGGDFEIEYLLTPDGKMKLRAYNRTESTILGRNIRSGIGLSFRKEFDNFKDLFKKEIKPQISNNKKGTPEM